jgi:hypothetical protein
LTVKTADGASLYAAAVGPVASKTAKLAETTQPKISGTPAVGQKLTVDNGTWKLAPTGYTYAWLRCNANGRLCTTIAAAAAASTYTLTAADAGKAIVASVTAAAGTTRQAVLTVASPAVAS